MKFTATALTKSSLYASLPLFDTSLDFSETIEIEKAKAYDSYNCFVYNWGSDKVYIND